MVARTLSIIAIVALAGCATTGGTFCDIAKPIRLSDATIDAMTDTEVAAALAHNERGRRLCNWKPAS